MVAWLDARWRDGSLWLVLVGLGAMQCAALMWGLYRGLRALYREVFKDEP